MDLDSLFFFACTICQKYGGILGQTMNGYIGMKLECHIEAVWRSYRSAELGLYVNVMDGG